MPTWYPPPQTDFDLSVVCRLVRGENCLLATLRRTCWQCTGWKIVRILRRLPPEVVPGQRARFLNFYFVLCASRRWPASRCAMCIPAVFRGVTTAAQTASRATNAAVTTWATSLCTLGRKTPTPKTAEMYSSCYAILGLSVLLKRVSGSKKKGTGRRELALG